MSIDRRRDARVRLPVVVVVAMGVLGASGCSDGSQRGSDSTVPVTGHRTSTTAVDRSTTTAAPTTTTPPTAPPSTRPLTTAPPSPLLDEVLAAYDAAYGDLIRATLERDPLAPYLGDHIDDGQLEKWREVIRALVFDNERAVVDESVRPWRRVEVMAVHSSDEVELEICRQDNLETVDASGKVVEPAQRPFRYAETLRRSNSGWKWSGRAWIDNTAGESDCAKE